MLTKDKRDEIQRRADAATKGPWVDDGAKVEGSSSGYMVDIAYCAAIIHLTSMKNNPAFIAHARTDVPDLLKTCNELKDQVATLMAKAVDYELKVIARTEGLEAEIEEQKRWAIAAQECNDITQRHCEEYRKTISDLAGRLKAEAK